MQSIAILAVAAACSPCPNASMTQKKENLGSCLIKKASPFFSSPGLGRDITEYLRVASLKGSHLRSVIVVPFSEFRYSNCK